MRTNIVIRLQYEALHFWEGCDIKEVSFLKYPHRHMFHIIMEKTVTHDDRDVEIIMFKRKVLDYLAKKYKGDFGGKSCEMLAKELLIQFECFKVEVSEDLENGSVVYLD